MHRKGDHQRWIITLLLLVIYSFKLISVLCCLFPVVTCHGRPMHQLRSLCVVSHKLNEFSLCVQSNYTHLLLQGEDRLYLNPEESLSQLSSVSRPDSSFTSPSAFIGNKQWHMMHLPHNYLLHNWPVRVSDLYLLLLLIAHHSCYCCCC